MADQLPFEPVNITALRAEFPNERWHTWSHVSGDEDEYSAQNTRWSDHFVASSAVFIRMAMRNAEPISDNYESYMQIIREIFDARAPPKLRVPQSVDELTAIMDQPHVAANSWRRHLGKLRKLGPRVVWAVAVRNPWILASDLQKM